MARSEQAPEGYQDLCNIMCSRVRMRIAEVLYERVEAPYSELASLVGVSESLLNHHLRKMTGLVEKGRSGYRLTWRGRRLYEVARSLGAAQERAGAGPDVAPLHKRILAFIVDILVFFISTGAILDPHMLPAISTIIGGAIALDPARISSGVALLIERSIIGYSNVFFAAFIFMTLLEAYNGQTLGKHLLRLRVVREDGSRLTLIESGLRNAGKVFMLPVDLALGLILYRRMGYIKLTDYMVKAIVVEEGPPSPAPSDGRRARVTVEALEAPG